MRMRRVLLLLPIMAMLGLLFSATPASAHGVGGVQPTNYRTVVHGIQPAVRGVTIRPIDFGARLQLRNETNRDVVVFGYDDEPYLRVGPDGLFRNERSPAVFLNRTSTPSGAVPHTFDADAPPDWTRISNARVATWHDHRAHWMGASAPASVTSAPDHRHVVIRDWSVKLRFGNEPLAVHGDVVWVPGPSPWPWILGAAALAVVVFGLSRRRPLVLPVALGVLVLSEIVHVSGAWNYSGASLVNKLGASAYGFAAIAIGLVAIAIAARRRTSDAIPVTLAAGVLFFIAGGLADLTTLTRSQVPTTVAPTLARLTIMLALGVGAGVIAGTAARLRVNAPRRPLAP